MADRGPGLEGGLRAFNLLVTVIGTAGLSSLRGTEPVMATQMMQGFDMGYPFGARTKSNSTSQ